MTSALTIADYRLMYLIRSFERRVAAMRDTNDIVGSVHLCNGQEAVAVGVTSVMQEADTLTATYRGHGWAIARGATAAELFAELLGRGDGVNGGRAGSAMLSVARLGFLGENSIVGGGVPIAVGAALAHRHRRTGGASVVVFGDGAMNQGSVHEALNFAAAFQLPVLFVCENNRYSELTPIADMVRDPRLHKRAVGYGIPGLEVDGNDPAAVRDVTRAALRTARAEGGPRFIEAHTQRIVGHYIGDAQLYREPGELDADKAAEPLVVGRDALLASGTTEPEIVSVEVEVAAAIDDAATWALSRPLSDDASVREHLYA